MMRKGLNIVFISCIAVVMTFAVIGCSAIQGAESKSDTLIQDDANTAMDDIAEYSAEEYSLSYRKPSFEVFEDAESNSVTFSYCKEGVEPAGSNVLTFYVIKDTQPRELLEEKIESLGGQKNDILEVRFAATPEICYYYVHGGSSGTSGLTTTQIFYTIPCGKDTILVDGFRTIGPNEGTEASIDADFEYIMQTLDLNN